MRNTLIPGERPLHWVASAKDDLLAMPTNVVRKIGIALGVAQNGEMHPSAKPWKGEGPGVHEIVSHFDGNTYRAVYTVRFEKAVYALHCFQKKSPRGIRTARTDVGLISKRLQVAKIDYETRYGKEEG